MVSRRPSKTGARQCGAMWLAWWEGSHETLVIASGLPDHPVDRDVAWRDVEGMLRIWGCSTSLEGQMRALTLACIVPWTCGDGDPPLLPAQPRHGVARGATLATGLAEAGVAHRRGPRPQSDAACRVATSFACGPRNPAIDLPVMWSGVVWHGMATA